MTQEDKDYRDQLRGLVEDLDVLRTQAPMLNATEMGARLRALVAVYRPESRPAVAIPGTPPTEAELAEMERSGSV